MKFKSFTILFTLGLFLATTPACSLKYDKISLDNITNIGKQIIDLMNKATGSTYSANSTSIQSLQTNLTKAYTHAKSINGNNAIAESWRILKDDLVGSFLQKWKTSGTLDKNFVSNAVTQVKASVAAITAAEKAKSK